MQTPKNRTKTADEGWTEEGLKAAKTALATARKFANPSTEAVKTSLKLPKTLWREATIRAIDEGRDLQDVIADALAAYLKSTPKHGGSR
jgi:hypothetical protein